MSDGFQLIRIRTEADVITARQRGRAQAAELGFSGTDLTLVTSAISEVVQNIVDHAQEGEVVLRPLRGNGGVGLQIVARDRGPGIADIAQAMQYGFSTRGSLGVGLPGAKWLMDEFDITSSVGQGTVVTMTKWRPSARTSAVGHAEKEGVYSAACA